MSFETIFLYPAFVPVRHFGPNLFPNQLFNFNFMGKNDSSTFKFILKLRTKIEIIYNLIQWVCSRPIKGSRLLLKHARKLILKHYQGQWIIRQFHFQTKSSISTRIWEIRKQPTCLRFKVVYWQICHWVFKENSTLNL